MDAIEAQWEIEEELLEGMGEGYRAINVNGSWLVIEVRRY